METTKKQPAVFLFIFLFTLISSCNSIKDSSSFNIKSCDELQAKAIPNEIIIKFDSCANHEDIDIYIKNEIPKFGKIKTRCLCNEELLLIELPGSLILEDALAKANGRLRPDGLGSAYLNFEINLDPPPANFEPVKVMRDTIEFSKNVIVAVIDGGINWDTELSSHKWNNPNFTGSDSCQADSHGLSMIPGDRNNHATIVSKLITKGLDKSQIKLMDLRVFDKDNNGSFFDALCAFNFALENGADIINMSWGYYRYEFHPELLNLFEVADAQDVLIVASAGNDGKNTDTCNHYPSGFDAQMFNLMLDNVISVAYLNETKLQLAVMSNFGPSSVSIAAPGFFSPTFQGSSYAAPKVTRMASIIQGLNPVINHNQIIDCIYNKVITTTPPLPVSTAGKLNEQMNTNCP